MKTGWFGRIVLIGMMLGCFGLLLAVGCPFYRLTGIVCPGCGLTRAWYSFLTGDWKSAMEYHPLFLVAPVYLMAVAAGDLPGWRYCRLRQLFCVGFTVLLLGVYWIRYGLPEIL